MLPQHNWLFAKKELLMAFLPLLCYKRCSKSPPYSWTCKSGPYEERKAQDFQGHCLFILFLFHFFFLVSWGGVRLSTLGMSATNWPIVLAPDDRWWRMWSSLWNENWQGKPKYSEKTCPSASLSTTNPTWLDLVSKPSHHNEKSATKRLKCGTAFILLKNCSIRRHSSRLLPTVLTYSYFITHPSRKLNRQE
jgi:hypothetical protein